MQKSPSHLGESSIISNPPKEERYKRIKELGTEIYTGSKVFLAIDNYIQDEERKLELWEILKGNNFDQNQTKIIKHNNQVVIKQFEFDISLNEMNQKNAELNKLKDNALEEAKIMLKLNHPNILTLKEIILISERGIQLILEYAEGEDLRKKLKYYKDLNKKIPEGSILIWLIQILLGLEYIHQNGVIHRDIKPDNIMLSSDQNCIKLGDFGIAKELLDNVNHTNTMKGTPPYIAPEIMSRNLYTNTIDIWSTGVTLYELCMGRVPYVGETMTQIQNKIESSIREPIIGYSEELIDLINRMLEKETDKRITIKEILNKPFIRDKIKTSFIKKSFKCNLGHKLIFSQKQTDKLNIFKCKECPNNMVMTEGRYTCNICNDYNLFVFENKVEKIRVLDCLNYKESMIDYIKVPHQLIKISEGMLQQKKIQEKRSNFLYIAYIFILIKEKMESLRQLIIIEHKNRSVSNINFDNPKIMEFLSMETLWKGINSELEEQIAIINIFIKKGKENEIDDEIKAYYYCILGDYYRFLLNLNCFQKTNVDFKQSANDSYSNSEKYAKNLLPTSYVRLQLALDYFVFKHDILSKNDEEKRTALIEGENQFNDFLKYLKSDWEYLEDYTSLINEFSLNLSLRSTSGKNNH